MAWGAVKGGKDKLASRVIIYEYLRSLGIVPDELEELELSSTIDIMNKRWNSCRERVSVLMISMHILSSWDVVSGRT